MTNDTSFVDARLFVVSTVPPLSSVTLSDLRRAILPAGQPNQADAADSGPEKRPRPPGQGQRQSGSAAQTQNFTDQHVSALVGSNISGVEVAHCVHQLGQRFNDQRAQ